MFSYRLRVPYTRFWLGVLGVRVSCVQERMRELYFERDSKRGLFATFTWLVEEVGELAEALLKNDRRLLEEEIADVVAWVLSIANMVGVDVEDALRKKYGIDCG